MATTTTRTTRLGRGEGKPPTKPLRIVHSSSFASGAHVEPPRTREGSSNGNALESDPVHVEVETAGARLTTTHARRGRVTPRVMSGGDGCCGDARMRCRALVTGRELRRRVAGLGEHLETERAVCARVLVVVSQSVHADDDDRRGVGEDGKGKGKRGGISCVSGRVRDASLPSPGAL